MVQMLALMRLVPMSFYKTIETPDVNNEEEHPTTAAKQVLQSAGYSTQQN